MSKPFYEAFDKKKKTNKFSVDDEQLMEEGGYAHHAAKKRPQNNDKTYKGNHIQTADKRTTRNMPQTFRQKDYIEPAFRVYKTEPKCGVFGSCGGCQLQHMTYEGQLKYKQHKIEKLLGSFGKVSPIVGMENPDHYRNKVHATFSYDKKGKIVAGIYEEDSHRVIPVNNCLIQNQQANQIIQTIRKLMPSFKLTPYDEDYSTGFLRHVLIRTGHVSKQVMVVLVGGTPIFPSKNNFTKALIKEHPEITTVIFNINSRRTSMVLGDRETVLYGKGYIEDTLCGKTFRLSSKSFYQVNSVQTEKLYKRALDMANLKGHENVLDAYCGIGTIGIIASDRAGEVIGVELNKDAVNDAVLNAKANKADNTKFYQGDAGDFMLEMTQEGEHLDVVILDPPRNGSDEQFLGSLIKLSPPTVVYISCGPESLARDLKVLVSGGYKVKEMVPFDMFPWTEHTEVVCRLTK